MKAWKFLAHDKYAEPLSTLITVVRKNPDKGQAIQFHRDAAILTARSKAVSLVIALAPNENAIAFLNSLSDLPPNLFAYALRKIADINPRPDLRHPDPKSSAKTRRCV